MLKQYLQFKLSQKLSPQQIQLMKLIQLPTQAFEQRLKQELEENPALESGKEKSDDFDDTFDNTDDFGDNESISAEDINVDVNGTTITGTMEPGGGLTNSGGIAVFDAADVGSVNLNVFESTIEKLIVERAPVTETGILTVPKTG